MKRHLYLLPFLYCSIVVATDQIVICTAANNGYLGPLLNLIGGLHKNDFDAIQEIAVFNLGLSETNIEKLNTIEKIQLYEIEQVHPDILKSFKTRKGGKPVPGWYAWKPVAIKQMLDKYPTVLWIDAGTTVNKSLSDLFEYINYKGYFFQSTCGQKMREHTTRYIIERFGLHKPDLKWLLDKQGLQPGFAGFTRQVYDSIIIPLYEMAKELRPYEDDGTAPGGFGNARHDQTLFSLLVLLNKLHIFYTYHFFDKEITLDLPDGKTAQFSFSNKHNGHIFFSRTKPNLAYFKQFIRYKDN